MTAPQQIPGTEQVIREEAHKTRRLLVWLIGGPVVLGLIVWAVIASSSGSESSSSADCGSKTSTCPLSGQELTESSTCAEYTADDNESGDPTKTNPAVYFTNQHNVPYVVLFDSYCASNPSEGLEQALIQMGSNG